VTERLAYLTFALKLTLGAGALAGCDEAKSLVGADDEEEDRAVAALALSTEHGTVPPNGATTVHVEGTRKDGEPARDGAPVTMTATLGSIEPSELRPFSRPLSRPRLSDPGR
jgi:hypothetical protein